MQVEFIGCTSAGKSTLAKGIVEAGRKRELDIVLADDFALDLLGLSWIKSNLLRKLLVNVTGVLASILAWRRNQRLYLFAARILAHPPISHFERLSLLRNVLKKAGIGEIVRARSNDQQIILMDEGNLHIAHNLFVHLCSDYEDDDILAFVELVSLPDVVVYVRQPETMLVERIMTRGHNRIAELSAVNVASFVKQAARTFDLVAQVPHVATRLLTVDGNAQAVPVGQEQGDAILDLVLRMARGHKRHNVAS